MAARKVITGQAESTGSLLPDLGHTVSCEGPSVYSPESAPSTMLVLSA